MLEYNRPIHEEQDRKPILWPVKYSLNIGVHQFATRVAFSPNLLVPHVEMINNQERFVMQARYLPPYPANITFDERRGPITIQQLALELPGINSLEFGGWADFRLPLFGYRQTLGVNRLYAPHSWQNCRSQLNWHKRLEFEKSARQLLRALDLGQEPSSRQVADILPDSALDLSGTILGPETSLNPAVELSRRDS